MQYRAKVRKVSSSGVTVEVPDLCPGETFGPLERIGPAPSVGDWVLVADVGEDCSPDLIVVGKATTDADPAPALPVGAITAYAGTTAPTGWHLCDGTAHGSSALQAILGSANAPDLRDRFIAGAGSTYARGDTGGAATVALATANLPAHDHSVGIALDGSVVSGNIYNPASAAQTMRIQKDGPYAGTGGTGAGLTGDTGSGTAHENRPPFYALVYIVKT